MNVQDRHELRIRTEELIGDMLHQFFPAEVLEQHPHLKETPRRFASWLLQYTQQPEGTLADIMKVFPEAGGAAVLEKDIPFSALCAHHFLPFSGKAAVMYIPRQKVAGLSKLARAVTFFSERATLQEMITENLAQGLRTLLQPHYVAVRLYDVTHGCMSVRGVRMPHAKTDTFIDMGDAQEIPGNRDLFWRMMA